MVAVAVVAVAVVAVAVVEAPGVAERATGATARVTGAAAAGVGSTVAEEATEVVVAGAVTGPEMKIQRRVVATHGMSILSIWFI